MGLFVSMELKYTRSNSLSHKLWMALMLVWPPKKEKHSFCSHSKPNTSLERHKERTALHISRIDSLSVPPKPCFRLIPLDSAWDWWRTLATGPSFLQYFDAHVYIFSYLFAKELQECFLHHRMVYKEEWFSIVLV